MANRPATGFGAPCAHGQYSHGGYLLVCSDSGTFRYALPEDLPQAPDGGYTERPAWYPRLADIFRAENPPACPVTGRVTFTNPPVRINDLLTTVPQGMMVGDHVTPIDHGYIGVKPLATPRAVRTDYVPVYAPADGEIIEISTLGSPTSIRIVIAHGCETYSVFMVLNRLAGALAYLEDDLLVQQRINTRIHLQAGEQFGEQRDNPIDFSVHDGASWLSGFVSPFAYAEGEAWKPYTVDPWPYFSPDLAEAYVATLQRLMPPRWGRIDQDVAGAAAGNWFLDGTLGYSGRTVDAFRLATTPLVGGPIEGRNSVAWSHLSLVGHWVQPAKWILSVGWWQDPLGDPKQWLIDLAANQRAPSQLTPEAGLVVYRLRRWEMSPGAINNAYLPIGYDVVPGPMVGLAAVQVNADGTLSIELVPGALEPSSFTGFTAAKRLYRR